MSEQLDAMKSSLMACAMARMGDLEHTDAEELGEVIDMIKDLEEAKYYCSITKAMEDRTKSDETQDKIDNALMMERVRNQTEGGQNYYGGRYPYMYYGDSGGRMYYDGSNGMGWRYYDGMSGGRYGYQNNPSTSSMPSSMRDSREGYSYIGRRGYVESKEAHEPDPVKLEKLEKYIKDFGKDIADMINGASPEEKSALQDGLMRIAQGIV